MQLLHETLGAWILAAALSPDMEIIRKRDKESIMRVIQTSS
jgi:hypothetical protein